MWTPFFYISKICYIGIGSFEIGWYIIIIKLSFIFCIWISFILVSLGGLHSFFFFNVGSFLYIGLKLYIYIKLKITYMYSKRIRTFGCGSQKLKPLYLGFEPLAVGIKNRSLCTFWEEELCDL
jgi:hypothetical protein